MAHTQEKESPAELVLSGYLWTASPTEQAEPLALAPAQPHSRCWLGQVDLPLWAQLFYLWNNQQPFPHTLPQVETTGKNAAGSHLLFLGSAVSAQLTADRWRCHSRRVLHTLSLPTAQACLHATTRMICGQLQSITSLSRLSTSLCMFLSLALWRFQDEVIQSRTHQVLDHLPLTLHHLAHSPAKHTMFFYIFMLWHVIFWGRSYSTPPIWQTSF